METNEKNVKPGINENKDLIGIKKRTLNWSAIRFKLWYNVLDTCCKYVR